MGKVRVTQEQANFISLINNRDKAIETHANNRPDSVIKDLKVSELARALYVGYEVELEFKEDEWVYNDINGCVFQLKKEQLEAINDDSRNIRHATPEEIAKEKERRWWAEHDRGVWELQEGDFLSNYDGYFEVVEVFTYGNYLLSGDTQIHKDNLANNYVVVCFAEDRKDA